MQSYIRLIFLFLSFLFSSLLLQSNIAGAEEEPIAPSYAYIALEPDIITNYAGDNSKKLGYLQLTIEMMLDDPSKIGDLEHHAPLLRSLVIEIVGAKNEQQIRSLTGREEIRRDILKRFRDVLIKETGSEIVKDVIFTKYLRQGG